MKSLRMAPLSPFFSLFNKENAESETPEMHFDIPVCFSKHPPSALSVGNSPTPHGLRPSGDGQHHCFLPNQLLISHSEETSLLPRCPAGLLASQPICRPTSTGGRQTAGPSHLPTINLPRAITQPAPAGSTLLPNL